MSGFSSQGAGAGLCANADAESAVSAAAIKNLVVENPVIIAAPGNPWKYAGISQHLEQITNAIAASIRRADWPRRAAKTL